MKDFRNLIRIGLLSFLVGSCCIGAHDADLSLRVESSSDKSLDRKIAVERLRQATIAIIDNDSIIKLPTCTGVWIAKDLILTAAHCVDDKNMLVVEYATKDEYSNNESSRATLVALDEKADLAMLLAPGNVNHPIISFSRDMISAGDSVDIVGHPVGYDWTYSLGYVSAIRNDQNGPNGIVEKTVQISSPVWMGSSGGGAFDAKGNLVGICSWVSKNGPHLSFFIHRDVIETFVLRNLAKINPRSL